MAFAHSLPNAKSLAMYLSSFIYRFHPDLEKRFAVSFDSSNLLNFLHENLQEKEELIADIKVCQKLLAEAHQNLGDMVRQFILYFTIWFEDIIVKMFLHSSKSLA